MPGLSGKRVTVMGLGRHGGGVAVTRWLVEQGCRVTVTDLLSEESLFDSVAQLRDVDVERFVLGKHDEHDFRAAEFVVVNPAVKPGNALVAIAREHGVAITSEIELFLERCPATFVGVTGTTGKSTTATMLTAILNEAGRTAWLGGNIGVSLLSNLTAMQPSDIVVVELSSFQLANLSPTVPMPQVAVVTNCSPHHLPWHGNWQNYVAAKQRLLREQPAGGIAVLGEDPEIASWRECARGIIATLVDDNRLPQLRIPGSHNRENARLAATAATSLGVEWSVIEPALTEFAGLEHRLEWVGEIDGRKFINDSKSTSVSAAIAAMQAVESPIWWLAGGVEEPADYAALATVAIERTAGAALYGAARHTLFDAVRSQKPAHRCSVFQTLDEAFHWTRAQSQPGDTILLSPACASFDQFADFEHRGRHFRQLVSQLG